MYKPLEIDFMEFAGLYSSLIAMRLPKRTQNDTNINCKHIGDNDAKLASNLVLAGNDHAKFTRGIIVYLQLQLQIGWMIEFETYRHGVECLSTSSTMHMELSKLKGDELAEEKQKGLGKKVYIRNVMLSYQALRAMYLTRRNHRHPDWQIFCDFIETLPYFDTFIYPEKNRA